MKKKPKTPLYTRKAIKEYEDKRKEFRKRVFVEEYEKLLAYWKTLIANRMK